MTCHRSETTQFCGICRDDITENQTILQCNHCFHTACIRSWLELSQSCPFCRGDVSLVPEILAAPFNMFKFVEILRNWEGTRVTHDGVFEIIRVHRLNEDTLCAMAEHECMSYSLLEKLFDAGKIGPENMRALIVRRRVRLPQ